MIEFPDEDTTKQQAEAWRQVFHFLNEVNPTAITGESTGIAGALRAIKEMANSIKEAERYRFALAYLLDDLHERIENGEQFNPGTIAAISRGDEAIAAPQNDA